MLICQIVILVKFEVSQMTQEGIEGYDSLYDMTNISLLYSYVSDLHHSRFQLKISGNSSRTHLCVSSLNLPDTPYTS